MSNKRKLARQTRVLAYLQNQLMTGMLRGLPIDKDRVQKEVKNLIANMEGKKKKTPKKEEKKDNTRWFIDVYSVKYGYVKRSERRKNKGKSRKGLKKTKTITLLKSVVYQDGLLEKYRNGQMGLSPKFHSFKARKDEPSFY